MAEIESPGFCKRRCEIDEYAYNVSELTLMGEIAQVDPHPSARHGKIVEAMTRITQYHGQIVEECKKEAAGRPCDGYIEEGVTLAFSIGSDVTRVVVYCPLVALFFAGAIE